MRACGQACGQVVCLVLPVPGYVGEDLVFGPDSEAAALVAKAVAAGRCRHSGGVEGGGDLLHASLVAGAGLRLPDGVKANKDDGRGGTAVLGGLSVEGHRVDAELHIVEFGVVLL
ncbi:hypothetical protein NGM37_40465, partial [Streptomyces sp. TRM76130]|nr:hypothetical protein [Streptomyces sp. TRM76130]